MQHDALLIYLTMAAPGRVWCAQYYFETIFPRIPKPVGNDVSSKLEAVGLPSKAVGNAGQGGGDRRGIEEGNRRPASVKVRFYSCSVLGVAAELISCISGFWQLLFGHEFLMSQM